MRPCRRLPIARYQELTGHPAGLTLRPGPRRPQVRERIQCRADAGMRLAPWTSSSWKWCPSCSWPVPVSSDQVLGVCYAHRVPYRAVEWDPPDCACSANKHAAQGLCQPLPAYLAAQAPRGRCCNSTSPAGHGGGREHQRRWRKTGGLPSA